jgi:hypothetical protein
MLPAKGQRRYWIVYNLKLNSMIIRPSAIAGFNNGPDSTIWFKFLILSCKSFRNFGSIVVVSGEVASVSATVPVAPSSNTYPNDSSNLLATP